MSHGTAPTREFLIHGEVATRFLLRTSWLRPGLVFAGSIVIYLIVPILWSYSDGNLVGHVVENDVYVEGFLSARNSYVFALPFMFAAVINYYLNTTFVVDSLVSRGVLESICTGDLHKLFAKHRHRWKTNTLTAIPAVVAIALFIWFLLNHSHSGRSTTWLFYQKDAPRPIAYYYAAIVHGFAVYVLLSWGLLHFRASHKLHRIFKDKKRFRINLVVLHPDDCMGLGPISDMVRMTAGVLIAISFVLFMWQVGVFYPILGEPGTLYSIWQSRIERLQRDHHTDLLNLPGMGTLAAWLGYCVFSPILFFAPLTSAREQMQLKKERILAELGFELTRETTEDTETKFKQYRLVQQARVWPFNVKTIASFIATLGTPLLLTLLTEFLKAILFEK